MRVRLRVCTSGCSSQSAIWRLEISKAEALCYSTLEWCGGRTIWSKAAESPPGKLWNGKNQLSPQASSYSSTSSFTVQCRPFDEKAGARIASHNLLFYSMVRYAMPSKSSLQTSSRISDDAHSLLLFVLILTMGTILLGMRAD